MRFLLTVIVVFGLLFFWRTSTGQQFFGSLFHAYQTGSGTVKIVGQGVQQAVEAGKTGIQAVGEQVQDLQKRTDDIRQGVQKLSSGGKLIEQGLQDLSGK